MGRRGAAQFGERRVDGGSTNTFAYNALGQWMYWQTGASPNYVYDLEGNDVGYYIPGSGWLDSMVPFGGQVMASYPGLSFGTTMYFTHRDRLGSWKMATTYSGANGGDWLNYPWGQFWVGQPPPFAGFADIDTLIPADFGRAREYNYNLGRWMTPDPLAGDISNPQSLNRYAYALNNPTTLTDPLGLDVCDRNPNARGCTDPYPRDAVGAGPPAFAGLFGLDAFDLAALGLLGTGPTNAALPGCTAEFATCGQFSGGTVGFNSSGFADLSNIGAVASAVASGEPYTEGATALFLFNFGDNLGMSGGGGGAGGGSAPAPAACPATILGRFNAQFGTSAPLNAALNLGAPDFGHVTININIFFPLGTLLPNQVVPGRFGGGSFGIGPTLHVAKFFVGPNPLANNTLFDIAQVHLDQGNPYILPFGVISHLNYVLTHSAGPCP